MDQAQLDRFVKKMQLGGLPAIAIESFSRAVRFVAEGGATTIGEDQIENVAALESLEGLREYEEVGRKAANRAVVIKLNGGLGTSMGLSRAKSLLPVRAGISFLDLIARQTLAQRASWGSELPLVLMNSYRTRDETLAALAEYEDLATDIPLDFLQHRVPRIDTDTWAPVEWAADESLEWCPPGHGDLYIAMKSSGMLDQLLAKGIRWAFVSNADNLGAVLDARVLGWVAANEIPFAMEVAERTEADKKGGHLARMNGRLMLREVAQCKEEDLVSFQDVAKYRYFNTNNLWLDLEALSRELDAAPGGLALPIIANEKQVSASDDTSPRCFQLETAMGSAIACFEGAQAIVVPRDRFAPVKTTNELLMLWSDAYEVTIDSRMVLADPESQRDLVIDLDTRFYGTVEKLAERFAEGPPSLAKCRRLRVVGDHSFGEGVVFEGEAQLVNETSEQVHVPDGSVIGSVIGDE
jgi:UTP--glucose-1-phosphate uridylyltransferase